jgi:serine protease
MKKLLVNLICSLLLLQLFTGLLLPANAEETNNTDKKEMENFVPGEIIVKFKDGIGKDIIESVKSGFGISTISKRSYSDFHRMKITNEKSVNQIIKLLEKNSYVEYVEPNYIAKISMTPNDPYFNYQWHLLGLDDGGISMEYAWDLSTGTGAVVAVIDTGIAVGSDLTNTCFISGYDFVNNDNNPTDDNGHGTHVAGTIAQSTNNNLGVTGIAFDACLMPVKVLDSLGYGSYADIIDGINFAVNNGANIISMSLEGSSPSTGLEAALANAYNNDVTCVAASGNSGQNGVAYPAAYDSYVIAVGATQYDKTRAPYSNYGTSLDVVAPGGNLNLDQNGDGYGDGVLQQTFSGSSWGYYFFDGTSMATPHVTGVAALLYDMGITTPDDIINTIQNSAIDLGATGWDIYYGHGLINAYNALIYNTDIPPTCIITSPSNSATVSGNVNIEVNATDDIGITKIDFYVDSTFIGSDTTKPYSLIWDSTTVGDGLHTISATAFDTASQSTSDSVNINVENINDPPVADAGSNQSVYVNYVVYFDGSNSYDPDGTIISYEWNYGDGSSTESGVIVSHVYTTIGNYTVTLTITDNEGLTDSDQIIVTVEQEPQETVEFFDSFEVSEWNNLWIEDNQNDWYQSTQRATDGSYSAEVDGPAIDATLTMVEFINLSDKSSAILTYSWGIESSWDTGEYIALDVYNGTWHEIKRIRGNVDPENVWIHETLDLNDYLVGSFKIRFRAMVSQPLEDGSVDNVKIISYGGQSNIPPNTPVNPIPTNGSTGIEINPTLSVDVSDPDGDVMDVTFYDASDNSVIGADTNVPSGGTASTTWSDLNYDTIYFWYVVAGDGVEQTTSSTWSFTTENESSQTVEFFDSFEVSEWNGLWFEDSQNDWRRTSQRATDGSFAAEIDGFANDATLTMFDFINLTGKTSVTLTYSWSIESSWDLGEYIALDVYDGTWQEIKRLRGDIDPENKWHHETIDLSSYIVDNFKIRFRARVNRANEDGFVDNVTIISEI